MLVGISPWWLIRPSDLDISTKSLLNAMTVKPNENRIKVINITIKNLKSSGIWDRCGLIYFLAAHDEQAARKYINPVLTLCRFLVLLNLGRM